MMKIEERVLKHLVGIILFHQALFLFNLKPGVLSCICVLKPEWMKNSIAKVWKAHTIILTSHCLFSKDK